MKHHLFIAGIIAMLSMIFPLCFVLYLVGGEMWLALSPLWIMAIFIVINLLLFKKVNFYDDKDDTKALIIRAFINLSLAIVIPMIIYAIVVFS